MIESKKTTSPVLRELNFDFIVQCNKVDNRISQFWSYRLFALDHSINTNCQGYTRA